MLWIFLFLKYRDIKVMEIYKSGERLILNEEEASMTLRCQKQHLEVSPKEGMIREY